jgi:holo-[acyl-carrier protein] synthase
MIRGIGIDVEKISKLKRAIEIEGESYIREVFTPSEIQYAEEKKLKYQHYAGRFAIKRAVIKALGTGWQHGLRWLDVETNNDNYGKPFILLRGKAKELVEKMGIKNSVVSISHSDEYAVGLVVFET